MADIFNTGRVIPLVTTADQIVYWIDNTPHTDLMTSLNEINVHHTSGGYNYGTSGLTHAGDLEIDGNLVVSGGLFEIDSDNTVIKDNNITINRGQPDQHSSGLIISSSAGTISYLETNSLDQILAGGKVIAYENSHGAITLLTDAISANDAVPISQAQGLVFTRPLSSDYPLADYQWVELSLTSGAWQVAIENHDKLISNTWVTMAGALNINRSYLAGAGTRNYALAFGGTSATGADFDVTTEYWNSYAWVSTGNLNNGRYGIAGCGIVNAALSWGGISGATPDYSSSNEKFTGFAWSNAGSGPANNTAYSAGCGIQNAALSTGGYHGGPTNSSYRYNGVSWVLSSTPMYDLAFKGALMGTQNSAIFAGYGTSFTADSQYTLIYNGFLDTWSSTGVTPTVSYFPPRQAVAGVGVLNNCMIMGGMKSSTSAAYDTVERFNGFVWAVETSLNATRKEAAGAGSKNNALLFGGSQTTTEQYLGEIPAEYSLWVDADADAIDGTSMSVSSLSGCEIVAEVTQGENTGGTDLEKSYISELLKEDWNSGFWQVIATLPVSTSAYGMAGFGSPNKTIACGGSLNASGYQKDTWSFNGLAWSAVGGGNLNVGRQYHDATGCFNSGVTHGGASASSTYLSSTETFDGVSWSNSGNLNVGRITHASCGVKSAALAIAGQGAGSAYLKSIEKFNGSTWATGTSIDVETFDVNHSAFGVWNAAVNFGGITSGSFPNPVATSRMYNGSSWFLGPSVNVSLYSAPGVGRYNNGLKVGGATGAVGKVTTERFNGLFWYITGAMTIGRYLNETSSGTGNSIVTWGGSAGAPVSTNSESYRSGTISVESRMTVYAYK